MWTLLRWGQVQRGLILSLLVVALGIVGMVQESQGKHTLIYVELERSGGQVPTYRPKFRVDVKGLSVEHRRVLDRLLKDADFFHQPTRFSGTGHPDVFEYRLHVQASDGSHVLIFHDQDGHPESIDKLAEWIRTHTSQSKTAQ